MVVDCCLYRRHLYLPKTSVVCCIIVHRAQVQISLHHLAITAFNFTPVGISSNPTSTFHILPSNPLPLPPIPAATRNPRAINLSHDMLATPLPQTRALPPTASIPDVADCTRCRPTIELYSSYAMAKLTVSVWATMSNRAAAINKLRSSSDKLDRSSIRESGGARDNCPNFDGGTANVRLVADKVDSGSTHSVKNAAADLVV